MLIPSPPEKTPIPSIAPGTRNPSFITFPTSEMTLYEKPSGRSRIPKGSFFKAPYMDVFCLLRFMKCFNPVIPAEITSPALMKFLLVKFIF